MVDLNKENQEKLPENTENAVSGSLKNEDAAELALKAKKRRAAVMWLRVIALLFVGFFFLAQCGMSKPKAKAAIIDSCIKNVPYATKWQQDLQSRNLQDHNDKLVTKYCVCVWDAPLQKLSDKQIQSFAKISTEEQLALLGGEKAFTDRDKQCIADLK